MTPEERMYMMIKKTYNPFLEKNFNDNQLGFAENNDLNDLRIPRKAPDVEQPPAINRALF